MVENIADQVREYFKVFPNCEFEQVEGFIEGLTIENFRMIKSRYKKKMNQDYDIENNNNKNNTNYYTIKNVKANFHEQPNKIAKLNSNTIEKLILDMLNNKSSIPESQIRIAVDFMVKVKKNLGEGKDLLIDAKYLIPTIPGDHQPGDMVEVDLNMEELLKDGRAIKEHGSIIDEAIE